VPCRRLPSRPGLRERAIPGERLCLRRAVIFGPGCCCRRCRVPRTKGSDRDRRASARRRTGKFARRRSSRDLPTNDLRGSEWGNECASSPVLSPRQHETPSASRARVRRGSSGLSCGKTRGPPLRRVFDSPRARYTGRALLGGRDISETPTVSELCPERAPAKVSYGRAAARQSSGRAAAGQTIRRVKEWAVRLFVTSGRTDREDMATITRAGSERSSSCA